MQKLDERRLRRSKCWRCLGCMRLEDTNFHGDELCPHFEPKYKQATFVNEKFRIRKV